MGLRFTATSLFPNLSLNDLLEIEFSISYKMNIPFDYNNKEFYELVWIYERLAEEIKTENNRQSESSGEFSLNNLQPGLFNKMQNRG